VPVYYTCPDCGYKQRSKAQKRVQCHSCGRSYLKRKSKKTRSKLPRKEEDLKFKKYSKKDRDDEES
jgi:rubredoxin